MPIRLLVEKEPRNDRKHLRLQGRWKGEL